VVRVGSVCDGGRLGLRDKLAMYICGGLGIHRNRGGGGVRLGMWGVGMRGMGGGAG
jgi:hypothetical protein